MASLEELRAERDLYITTKNQLLSASSAAGTLKDEILNAISLLNDGVVIGGKGFDEGMMEKYSEKIGNISSDLQPIIDYCEDKINKLQELIDEEVLKQTGVDFKQSVEATTSNILNAFQNSLSNITKSKK